MKKDLLIVDQELVRLGHETFIFWRNRKNWKDEVYKAEYVWREIVREIDKSDLVLGIINFDVKSEGQLLELGFAKGREKKVKILCLESITPYLRPVMADECNCYKNEEDMIKLLSEIQA